MNATVQQFRFHPSKVRNKPFEQRNSDLLDYIIDACFFSPCMVERSGMKVVISSGFVAQIAQVIVLLLRANFDDIIQNNTLKDALKMTMEVLDSSNSN